MLKVQLILVISCCIKQTFCGFKDSQYGEETFLYESEDSLYVPKDIFQYESEDDKKNLMYVIRAHYTQKTKVEVYSVRDKKTENKNNTVMSLPGFDPSEGERESPTFSLKKNSRQILQQENEKTAIFEKVIGTDEREKVLTHMEYPYSAIGFIVSLDQNGQQFSGCTGALISRRVVLTAAHCLYVQSDVATPDAPAGMSPGFQFYAGRSGNSHFPVANAIDAVVTMKYANLSDEHDYGVIILDRDVGAETGWMGMGVNCAQNEPLKVNIAGYPFDKSPDSDVMYKSACDNVEINQCEDEAGFFKYVCDTERGMSGAPVWVHFENVRLREIRGIHSQGKRAVNQGVYISPQIFKFVQHEIEESNKL